MLDDHAKEGGRGSQATFLQRVRATCWLHVYLSHWLHRLLFSLLGVCIGSERPRRAHLPATFSQGDGSQAYRVLL